MKKYLRELEMQIKNIYLKGTRIYGIELYRKLAIIIVYGPSNVNDGDEIANFYNLLMQYILMAKDR